MTTPEEISYALQLIDAYIDQIEDWEAQGAYDKNIKDFFGFLREYKANVGQVINIVKAATGLTPEQIRNKDDAYQIRELLRRTLTSETLTRRRSSDTRNSGQLIMSNSVLEKGQKTLMRSNLTYQEYRHEMERSLSVTDEQWMFDKHPDDLLDTVSLTEIFLESGGVAFGYPPFERELFNVFHCWLGSDEDKFLKVRMYSRALIEQLPDGSWQDLRENLSVYADGDLEKWDESTRDTWPGLPEEYLKNWNWRMHRFSSSFWDEKKAIKEARMDLIFSEKYPGWLKK